MKKFLILSVGLTAFAGLAQGANILTPGDFIIGIDVSQNPSSNHPAGEPPSAVLDGNSGTKYLNFGEERSGLIVTPASGSSTVQSLVFTTAGDAEARDPASFTLYGTNDPIISTNNSFGTLEGWSLITTSALALPSGRQTIAPAVGFLNGSAFTSYRLVFDTVKDAAAANSMQIADIQMFSSMDGTGTGILGTTDAIIATDLDPLTYPAGEPPANAINGTNAKYLHFGKEGAGFITTPSAGPSILESFTITTANDALQRDPASYSIYGTNDAITSADGSDGSAENWILIQSGALALTDVRNSVQSPVAIVGNTTAYSSYRVVFDSLKDSANTNSMQIAEIQFEGQLVPEPSSALLGLFALLPLVFRRRRA